MDQTQSTNVYETIERLVYNELQRTGMNESTFCVQRANLQRQHFSNQIKNRKDEKGCPRDRTLLAYAIGVGMNVRQIKELFQRGKQIFSLDDPRYALIAHELENGNYDIEIVNSKLVKMELNKPWWIGNISTNIICHAKGDRK